ncbi:MAG: hypothetical protein M3M96_03365 [Candidatus Eremiobacteraeota bacterium]|nr:hypothetical protein [Candidatus Eremiobacteraeota bacterium]
MNTNEHLTEMKRQCQEAARSFQELTDAAGEETTSQDQFNASILKALKHAHDAIESLIH